MFLSGRPSKALRPSKVSSLIGSYNPLSLTVQRLAAILARLLLASTNNNKKSDAVVMALFPGYLFSP